MPEMALEDLLGALVNEKEGKRGTEIKGISRGESILVLERGHFKCIKQCLVPLDMNVLIERTKSLSIYGDWSGSWSWKHEVGVGEDTIESISRGQ